MAIVDRQDQVGGPDEQRFEHTQNGRVEESPPALASGLLDLDRLQPGHVRHADDPLSQHHLEQCHRGRLNRRVGQYEPWPLA